MWKRGTKKGEVFMTFTINNGKVPYIMTAGNDFVSDEMPIEEVEKMYANCEKRASNRFPGYPVCVDGKYFFAATPDTSAPKKGRQKNA